MCGIFGITGSTEPLGALLDGLESLEYRGYDSAGVAFIDASSDALGVVRAAELTRSVEKLRSMVSGAPVGPGAAIGHTRWATHGAPTERNAHPHVDCSGTVAIVHNGIIENHRELAEALLANGHVLASDTDTEVIAHLIEAELACGSGLREAVRRSMAILRGDFALAVLSLADPDAIVVARRTSPIVIGRTAELGLVASDIAALVGATRELYLLGDDQVAEIRPGSVDACDLAGNPVRLRRHEVSWSVADAKKDGYDDFMSKEIHEQPHAIAQTLLGRIMADGRTEIEELTIPPDQLASYERVLFLGCGSSYHAALVGRQSAETWARVHSDADISSEFRYRLSVVGPETLVVAVSQSGETVDSLHAIREARRRGAGVITVSNVVDSLMARESDGVCYTHAGPEIGVASTKCHVAQLALLQVLALHLARARGTIDDAEFRVVADGLEAMPALVTRAVARAETYMDVARRFAAVDDVYFLGRRSGLPIAMEGALKLKELAYVRAEAYPAGEMKHGPISLVKPGAVVVVVATRTGLWEKVMANVEEMRSRGATIVAIADEGDGETAGLVDAVLEVPRSLELLTPIVAAVPNQCFAYAIARARGNDVDRPRNLAKVVTVE
ncbi:MAG: glutamine--fructose-6-phosphate transaminase (isomerizing) [Acidimicrobiales bacterium]|jgi:glucosamine--fructose-6-phosphate aminotransferase (isomerizing)